jgi:vitamin B12 transporter
MTRALDAAVAGALAGVRYSLGASTFGSDGAYAFNNAYANRTVSGRIGVERPRSDGAFTARYTDGLFHFPTDGAGRLVDGNAFRSSESLALGLEGGHRLASRLEARASLTYHNVETLTDDQPDSPADTVGFYASTSTNQVDRLKADLRLNVHATEGTMATLGFEVERQSGKDGFSSQSQFGPFESSSENERENRAAYAQVVAAPVERVTLTAGARAEDNDRFGRFLTWRAGANIRVGRSSVVRAAVGTAFKEPTFFENYAEGFTLGNAALDPEQSRSPWDSPRWRGTAPAR